MNRSIRSGKWLLAMVVLGVFGVAESDKPLLPAAQKLKSTQCKANEDCFPVSCEFVECQGSVPRTGDVGWYVRTQVECCQLSFPILHIPVPKNEKQCSSSADCTLVETDCNPGSCGQDAIARGHAEAHLKRLADLCTYKFPRFFIDCLDPDPVAKCEAGACRAETSIFTPSSPVSSDGSSTKLAP
jgi:hypothetical protein